MAKQKKGNKKSSKLESPEHPVEVSIEEQDTKTKISGSNELYKSNIEEQKDKEEVEELKEEEVTTIDPIQDPGTKTIKEHITDAEQFPYWHPYHRKLHVELYKFFQKSTTQVFLEPIYKRDEGLDQDMDPLYDLLHPSLEFE